MVVEFGTDFDGIIELPSLGKIMQMMVILREFPLVVHCLGWCHIMIPVTILQLVKSLGFESDEL